MKAVVQDQVIAESNDIVEKGGYAYFPPSTVRTEWLEKTAKTPKDLECPHSVQFYDVVVDGARYPRAAWVYEAPKPAMAAVKDRYGFWNEVEVG